MARDFQTLPYPPPDGAAAAVPAGVAPVTGPNPASVPIAPSAGHSVDERHGAVQPVCAGDVTYAIHPFLLGSTNVRYTSVSVGQHEHSGVITVPIHPHSHPCGSYCYDGWLQQETEYVLAGGAFSQSTLNIANSERSSHLFDLLNYLTSLAQYGFSPDLVLPSTPSAEQQALIAGLKATPSAQQQAKFYQNMIDQHDAAIALTNAEVRRGEYIAWILQTVSPWLPPLILFLALWIARYLSPPPFIVAQIASGMNKDVVRVAQEVYLPVLTAHRRALQLSRLGLGDVAIASELPAAP